MTECDNAEIRDLLPDYVAEMLSASDLSRVTMHLSECTPCQQEVALLRVARAARPQAVHIDVAAIVALIGKPGQPTATQTPSPLRLERSGARHSATTDNRGGSAPPVVSLAPALRSSRARRPMWQMAAVLGVVAVGGLSVVVAERGAFGLLNGGRADSVRSVAAAEPMRGPTGDSAPPLAGTSNGTAAPLAVNSVADATTRATASRATLVSVGDLSDYTDAELQRMFDRIDKWDGATSSEVMPTLPIVPVPSGGSER